MKLEADGCSGRLVGLKSGVACSPVKTKSNGKRILRIEEKALDF